MRIAFLTGLGVLVAAQFGTYISTSSVISGNEYQQLVQIKSLLWIMFFSFLITKVK